MVYTVAVVSVPREEAVPSKKHESSVEKYKNVKTNKTLKIDILVKFHKVQIAL